MNTGVIEENGIITASQTYKDKTVEDGLIQEDEQINEDM